MTQAAQSSGNLMNAVVYTRYGAPEVLQFKEVSRPTPNDNEVLIKVHAAEATKSDCELRSFKFPVMWFWLPLRLAMGVAKPKRQILGMYFAGEVQAVGRNVATFKNGDQIFGSAGLRMGAYGEYICLPESYTIIAKPTNMSFAEAAAVPLGGLNALHFLTKANIQKGERVLINGAGGSIGIFGVQLAKALGAEVTAVDHGIKENMLRQVGADHFIDYRNEDFSKSSQTYDVILNLVARRSYADCMRVLNSKGRYLLANPRLSDMIRSFFTTTFTDKTATFSFASETRKELLALKDMIEAGKLTSVVDKIYPMAQAAEAHQRVETEQRLGSVIIATGTLNPKCDQTSVG